MLISAGVMDLDLDLLFLDVFGAAEDIEDCKETSMRPANAAVSFSTSIIAILSSRSRPPFIFDS